MHSLILISVLTCNQLIDIARTITLSDFLSEFQKTQVIFKLQKITLSCPLIYREYKF